MSSIFVHDFPSSHSSANVNVYVVRTFKDREQSLKIIWDCFFQIPKKMSGAVQWLVTIGIFVAQLYIFFTVESKEIRVALAIFAIFKIWQASKKRVKKEEIKQQN